MIYKKCINEYGGVFRGGLFLGGIFRGEIYHGGIWRGGIFRGGVLRGGIFRGGVLLVPSPNTIKYRPIKIPTSDNVTATLFKIFAI